MYKYTGSKSHIVIAGIKLVKNKAVKLTDEQLAKLKNHGIGQALLNNGAIVKIDEPKKTVKPKPEPKPTKTAKEDKTDAK